MATLETQYKNYLNTNPDPVLSFEDWKSDLVNKIAPQIEKIEKELSELKK